MAVKGSNAPKIAVVVGPIRRIATFIVSSEIIVGNIARAIEQANTFQSFMGCNSVQNLRLKIKTVKPINIT